MKISGRLADEGFHTFDSEHHTNQGHKIFRTWFVVADHKSARIFRKISEGLEQIANAEWGGAGSESFDGHVTQISDGRDKKNPDSHGKKKPHSDREFIHSLVKWLGMADNEHAFDRLVLVADPKTLGHLRENLTSNLQARVTEELDKDLTKLPMKEVEEHLKHIIVF